MAFMQWTRELEFGIPVIDDQHKRIIGYINELDDARRTGNHDETKHVMEGLLNYTVTHFDFEESLQEKANYPFLKAHRRIHELFMKKVADVRSRSAHGEDVAPELLKLLQGWLASHIMSEDRDYVEAVRKVTASTDKETASWIKGLLGRFSK